MDGSDEVETFFGNYDRLQDGTFRTSIPEPFWERSRRTWFRYKPMCCGRIFKDRSAYEDHYIIMHSVTIIQSAPPESR